MDLFRNKPRTWSLLDLFWDYRGLRRDGISEASGICGRDRFCCSWVLEAEPWGSSIAEVQVTCLKGDGARDSGRNDVFRSFRPKLSSAARSCHLQSIGGSRSALRAGNPLTTIPFTWRESKHKNSQFPFIWRESKPKKGGGWL